MSFKAIVFSSRNAGTSPAEFKASCDSRHVPLLKRVTGSAFPISHVRRYIARQLAETAHEGATQRNSTFPAVVIWGKQSDFDYDAIADLRFTVKAAFHSFGAAVTAPDAAREIRAMEESFLNPTRNCAVVIGAVSETTA